MKAEPGATPMTRDASMTRQGSGASVKAGENSKAAAAAAKGPTGTPGDQTDAAVKAAGTPTAAASMKADVEQRQLAISQTEDAWAESTIDPASLLSTFRPFESAAGGAITDTGVYRSLTPNDTPESSKDSGSSEPNSDISETANLEIDLKVRELDPDFLTGISDVQLDGLEGFDDTLMIGGAAGDGADAMLSGGEVPFWDDFGGVDFSKGFTMDLSQYMMDTI